MCVYMYFSAGSGVIQCEVTNDDHFLLTLNDSVSH